MPGQELERRLQDQPYAARGKKGMGVICMLFCHHWWLVVSNILLFSISYMGCHPSHWLSDFSRWLWHHQPDWYVLLCWLSWYKWLYAIVIISISMILLVSYIYVVWGIWCQMYSQWWFEWCQVVNCIHVWLIVVYCCWKYPLLVFHAHSEVLKQSLCCDL